MSRANTKTFSTREPYKMDFNMFNVILCVLYNEIHVWLFFDRGFCKDLSIVKEHAS